jgi:hypothetical protein
LPKRRWTILSSKLRKPIFIAGYPKIWLYAPVCFIDSAA